MQARKFVTYHKYCQSFAPTQYDIESPIKEAVEDFASQGIAFFKTPETTDTANSVLAKMKAEETSGLPTWNDDLDYHRYLQGDPFIKFPEFEAMFSGPLGIFLTAILGSNYSIYFSACYKSVRERDTPKGSQIWHRDGGPGTCINLMFCLSETTVENGAMKSLPWKETLEIFTNERATILPRVKYALAKNPNLSRDEIREIRCEYYREQIEKSYQDKIIQPEGGPGLVYAFRNNCLHGGGFPEPDRERYVIVLHIYPSKHPINLGWYRKNGTKKLASAPRTPDEIDLLVNGTA